MELLRSSLTSVLTKGKFLKSLCLQFETGINNQFFLLPNMKIIKKFHLNNLLNEAKNYTIVECLLTKYVTEG